MEERPMLSDAPGGFVPVGLTDVEPRTTHARPAEAAEIDRIPHSEATAHADAGYLHGDGEPQTEEDEDTGRM